MKAMPVFFATLLLAAATPAADDTLTRAQRELVEAERAFVQLAAERGFRDSFYEFFAPDGIGFNPHPFRMKPYLANQPSVPGPMGAVWAPVHGDISQAGDLGWNTGPVVFEGQGNDPDRHGMFFSVWKRQPDGRFKVVLDVGSGTPAAAVSMAAPFRSSHRPSATKAGPVGLAAGSAGLLAVEREFLATAASESLGRAYGSRLAEDARVHRPSTMPVVGSAALAAWANALDMKLRGEPLAADVAVSGDLGYAYGSYEFKAPAPGAGYFARVWKRSPAGDWRIVFDTMSPLPTGVKPLTAELAHAEDDYFAGRWAAAEAAYRRHVERNPGDPFGWHRLGSSQIRQKRYPEAIRNLERAVEVGRGTPAYLYNLACAHALAGASDQALDYVERAIAAGLKNRAQYESDADLASLRELPRFKTLMSGLGAQARP